MINIYASVNCNLQGKHKEVNLTQGMYKATLIQGVHTAWLFATPNNGGTWNTLYKVYSSDGTEHTGGEWVGAATALAAFNGTPNKVLTFYQPVDGIAKFCVADNSCGDNSGGVSLEIVPMPVPTEHSTWGKVKALYR